LLVLQEIISSMTGIKPIEDVTFEQVDALGAGATVRREALMFESSKLSAKSSHRLMSALISSNLVAAIGILMGIKKRDIVFTEDIHELKVLGWLHDNCKRSLLQYFDFVSSHLPPQEYAELFVCFEQLHRDYGLEISTAFHILRPTLKYKIDVSFFWYVSFQDI
jgi:hypothetical protein